MFFCLLKYVWPYAQIAGNGDNRAVCRQTAQASSLGSRRMRYRYPNFAHLIARFMVEIEHWASSRRVPSVRKTKPFENGFREYPAAVRGNGHVRSVESA
jgi:hypothetical protein